MKRTPHFELELGMDQFRADMDYVGGRMWQGFRKGLHEAGKVALAYIRDEAPARTGRLRASLYYRVMPGGDVVRFFANREVAPYAVALDEGHPQMWEITGEPLRFVINGEVRYADHVVHPGVEAREFTRKGLQKAKPEIRRILIDSVIAEATSGRPEGAR